MNPEDNPEIVDFVVKKIGQNRKESDITLALCERYGLDWDVATKTVRKVSKKHESRIAKRQAPLILVIGIGLLMLGCLELIFVEGLLESILGGDVIGFIKTLLWPGIPIFFVPLFFIGRHFSKMMKK